MSSGLPVVKPRTMDVKLKHLERSR